MNVLLYRVGRNLNRVYRTCEAFGVNELLLLECTGTLRGNLFNAKGRVNIFHASSFVRDGALGLETFYDNTIYNVDWTNVRTIVIGGESSGIPRSEEFDQKARIPMVGEISGLTVEAALAIALYEWRRKR